jgi:hypothetical protein
MFVFISIRLIKIAQKLQAPVRLDHMGLPDAEPAWASLNVKNDSPEGPVLSNDSVDQLKALGYLQQ